jgi:hypothetical protein
MQRQIVFLAGGLGFDDLNIRQEQILDHASPYSHQTVIRSLIKGF